MSGRDDSPLTPEQISAVKDESIDFSDIAELELVGPQSIVKRSVLAFSSGIPDADEYSYADQDGGASIRECIRARNRTDQITIRIKRSVLAYFKAPGKGYQTRMNRVRELRADQDGGSRQHPGLV